MCVYSQNWFTLIYIHNLNEYSRTSVIFFFYSQFRILELLSLGKVAEIFQLANLAGAPGGVGVRQPLLRQLLCAKERAELQPIYPRQDSLAIFSAISLCVCVCASHHALTHTHRTRMTTTLPTLLPSSRESEDDFVASFFRNDDSPEKRSPQRVRSVVSTSLTCPITHEIMVQPVLADDGHTYELGAICRWLQERNCSPLIPSVRISTLFDNRIVKHQIDEMMASGEFDPETRDEYTRRKARIVFDNGDVERAACMGLAVAQGQLAESYFKTKEYAKAEFWARKGAAQGDCASHRTLGVLYADAARHGLDPNDQLSMNSLGEAMMQGCAESALLLGKMMMDDSLELAFILIQKAHSAGNTHASLLLGRLHYNRAVSGESEDVEADLRKARFLFGESDEHEAQFALGLMLLRGEGGVRDMGGGLALWSKSAEKGNARAVEGLQSVALFFDDSEFAV